MPFRISRDNRHLELLFSASLDNIDRAAETVKEFLLDTGLTQLSFDVLLGLRESLNNAVINGSRGGCRIDRNKNVACRLKRLPDRLMIEVEDEGEGFDWRAHLGKEPPPMEEESGRGLPILERYFETIWFNDKGNRLVLMKLL